ncbi:hypothetical protein [Bacillus altitudinis]|nr:hypothetical protein [Bacillus altitudinis]
MKEREWDRVSFEGKVGKGCEGKRIENMGVVKGDNVEEGEKGEK